MKALILAQGYPSPANPVAGAFHKPQFAHLADSGVELTVVVPTPYVPPGLGLLNPRWATYARLPREQFHDGITILRPRYLTAPGENRLFAADVAMTRSIRKLALPRPDVIHAFYATPTGLTARTLAHDWDIPYAISLLGDDVNIYPHHNERSMQSFLTAVNGASAVIANGPSLARAAESLSGRDVLPLSIGVDPSRFNGLPSREEARRKLSLPLGKKIVLYVGNLLPQKGVPELSIALAGLDRTDTIGLFVGDGPLREELEGQANTLCSGPQPTEAIPLYMAAADLLALPSHHEGLPTVVIEAGFSGLPVIGSDIGPNCDLLDHERGYLFGLHNPDAIAQSILKVFTDPDDAAARARRLYAHVQEEHNVARNTERLIRLYQSVSQGTSPAPGNGG